MDELTIEEAGSKDSGPCPCCRGISRSVWGFIYRGGSALAAYFVQWTVGEVDRHGAHFDFIVGTWGDGASKSGRYAISLAFKRTDSGPAFQVIDACNRPTAASPLVGNVLRRDQVVGTDLAPETFKLVDAVWAMESRLTELVGHR